MFEDKERARQVARMYKNGDTMHEIGQTFGGIVLPRVTRSRVQQILAKQGLARRDGGAGKRRPAAAAYRVAEKRREMEARLQAWTLEVLGSPLETIRQAGYPVPVINKRGTPSCRHHPIYQKYLADRFQSRRRCSAYGAYIGFLDWCTIWSDSGHFSRDTGPERGWCLVRKDAAQPWGPDNAQIVRQGAWMRDYWSQKTESH